MSNPTASGDHAIIGDRRYKKTEVEAALSALEHEVDPDEVVQNLLDAWEVFSMGVPLFAPVLLSTPAFMKLYDAFQDFESEGR